MAVLVVNSYAYITADRSVWHGDLASANSEELIFSGAGTPGDGHGEWTATYEGHDLVFEGGNLVGGTLTGYVERWGDEIAICITDFEIEVQPSFTVSGTMPGLLLGEVLAGSDSVYASGNPVIDTFGGDNVVYVSDGMILGGDENDHFHPLAGVSAIHGGAGLDHVYFEGSLSDYDFGPSDFLQWEITSLDGTMHVDVTADRLVFDDGTLAMDVDGSAGTVYRLYEAAFDRPPDQAGISYWVSVLDGEASPADVAESFVSSAEFAQLYGSEPTTGDYIELLYANVLNRAPDAEGSAYWQSHMDAGMGRGDLLLAFSESQENQTNTNSGMSEGIWLI